MTQQTTYPIRNGLSLPRGENLQSVEVFSEGGLDLTQGIIENRPGCASELINFEASLTGGYRRINGFQKYSSTIVPGQGSILGVAVFWPSSILAARRDETDGTKYNIFYGSGTSWTQINPATTTQTGDTNTNTTLDSLSTGTANLIPGQSVSSSNGDIPDGTVIASIISPTAVELSQAASASNTGGTITFSNPLNWADSMILQSCSYNWTGTVRIILFDGINPAYKWDGTTMTILNATGSATDPQFGIEYRGYLVVGGYSSNYGAIKYSAPLDDEDWNPVDGAAEIVIGGTVTGLRSWRDNLIIFTKNLIKKMIPNTLNTTGVTPPPAFQVQPISSRIGCLEGRTIKEINGDLVFLAPDGIRTISGTVNIGDTESSSISRSIQSIISGINPTISPCHALVIHKKTQYRLFYPTIGGNESTSLGIIGSLRRFRDGHEAWEWGKLKGIRPTCCDSGFLSDNDEYVIHGGESGYVYRQERGNDFDGSAVNENYTTVPLELGDIGLRKALHRTTTYVNTSTRATDLILNLIYNYSDPGIIQPNPYILSQIGGFLVTWDGDFNYDEGNRYNSAGNTVVRTLVQGSGFTVKLKITSGGTQTIPPYVIQGFYIEFFPAGRR